MKIWNIALLALLFTAWPGLGLRAGSPALVPVQGVLTDALGVPLNGEIEMTLSLYDASAGGQELWTETQTVMTLVGFFTTYLGSVQDLELATFRDHEELWLGIRVAQDSEMPRIRIGTSPFAGYAEHLNCGSCDLSFINVGESGDSIEDNTIDSSEIEDGTITTDDTDGVIDEAVNLRHARNSDSALANPDGTLPNRVFVAQDGRVGVGTTAPGTHLEVNGTLGFTGGQGPFCISANSCPIDWVDRGQAGFIINVDTGTCPYSLAGAYAAPYYWCLYRLCCTS